MSGTQSAERRADQHLAVLLLVSGLVGSIAALVLTIEKFALLSDSSYVPTCSLNPVLSCGSIMRTPQAEVLGFPNPLLGLAAFPVVAATGAAILAGARLARWYWIGLQIGVTAGVGFVAWLIFQSLYRIGALCPYCMVVWVVTVPVFWYVTLRNVRAGVLGPAAARARPVQWLASWHAVGLTLVGVFVLGLILERFWRYWSTLAP